MSLSLSSSPPPSLSSAVAASVSAPATSSNATDQDSLLHGRATIQHVLDQITKWQHVKTQQQQRLALNVDDHHRQQANMPFVTASFAQSLNGILAPYCEDEHFAADREKHSLNMIMDGTTTTTTVANTSTPSPRKKKKKTTTSNYPLSAPSSLVLTHGIRSIHDGILIGGRTLSMDNPRLTNRLWTRTGNNNAVVQPIPIVLDTHLTHLRRLGAHCRAATAAANNNKSIMIVCCSHQAATQWKESPIPALEHAVQILPCRCCSSRTVDNDDSDQSLQLDLKDVLSRLCDLHGIQSIMVEGGATVLSSFLEQNLIDCLCITIAPTILMSGSSLKPNSRQHIHLSLPPAEAPAAEQQQPTMGQLKFLQLGSDCCFLCPLLSGWNVPPSQQ
jgi:riboflavin biosynthesis pyrimidine reductase